MSTPGPLEQAQKQHNTMAIAQYLMVVSMLND